MSTAILKILAILLPILIQYLQDRKSPSKEAEDVIQRARKALAKNDGMGFAAVAADQHDRVQQALRRNKG